MSVYFLGLPRRAAGAAKARFPSVATDVDNSPGRSRVCDRSTEAAMLPTVLAMVAAVMCGVVVMVALATDA
jgi:hypothetical protein